MAFRGDDAQSLVVRAKEAVGRHLSGAYVKYKIGRVRAIDFDCDPRMSMDGNCRLHPLEERPEYRGAKFHELVRCTRSVANHIEAAVTTYAQQRYARSMNKQEGGGRTSYMEDHVVYLAVWPLVAERPAPRRDGGHGRRHNREERVYPRRRTYDDRRFRGY